MTEPQWDLFVGVAVLATVALLMLARATQGTLSDPGDPGDADLPPPSTDGAPEPRMSTGVLLVNVAFSHGLLGGTIVGAAWYARVPPRALGVGGGPRAVAAGVAFGVALYVANEVAARAAERWGVEHDEHLRELLAPDTAGGWAVLLFGVLPVVAGVEELLFRAALIGAPAAGFGLPAWGLAVVSSVAFGLGHGLQGPGGVAVTGALGFALAAAFVLTGSLLVVVVAHYLVNALEFVVHEGLDTDPFARIG